MVLVVPTRLAADRIEAKETVISRAEKHFAADNARAGFRVAFRREFPQLLAGRRVKAVELAIRILMEAFANVQSAVSHARRGKDLLHRLVFRKRPNTLLRVLVQTVDFAVISAEYRRMGGSEEETRSVYERRRINAARFGR